MWPTMGIAPPTCEIDLSDNISSFTDILQPFFHLPDFSPTTTMTSVPWYGKDFCHVYSRTFNLH